MAQRAPAPRGVPPQVLVPGEGVNIRADTLTEDAERRLVIGEGFVDLQFLDNRLQADRVEINVDTGEGVAQGNVVFRDKENRLVCDRIEFNTRRQQALLYGVRGEIGRLYKITGARVERQSPVKYRILDGSLSTCKAPIPEWQFRSRSIDVTLEGFAIARQPTFWVAGFPVAFLPYMVAPVKTKRATGFLVPRIGQSNRDGFKYDQAFFWAFSENADATFGLEYRVKRGFIPKVEGRYRLSRTTWGRADFKYLDDDLTGKTFYRFRAEHRQEFWNQFTGFYRAERVNDLDFDSEFEEEVGVRTRRDVESLVNVQRNWDRASLRFNAQFLDSAEESRKEFFQRFPDASFNLSPTVGKVGPIVISPSVNTSIVRFNQRQEQQEDEVWRLDAAPRLSLPITGLTWFTFTPFAEGRITYYSDGRKAADRSRKSGAFTREILATGVTSEGPRFFRTFPVGFKRFPAFKHLTQTKFSYIFRPDIDEGDRQKIVKIDSIDAFERQHRLTYSWENRILAKIRTGRQSFETREVLSLTVSNFLDINRLSEDKDRPLGDVTFRLESKPFRLWRIGFDADYNIYDEEVSSYGISLDLRQGRDWFLRHETRFKDRKGGEADELNNNFSAGLRILKVFYLEGGARWTEEKAKLLEKNIRFRFQDCCWGITLEFLERDDETLFQIGFNLVGLIGDEDAPFFKFGRARKTTTE
ncbi:MAG: LPS-assembly protein LptD [Nitrospinota bacterium]